MTVHIYSFVFLFLYNVVFGIHLFSHYLVFIVIHISIVNTDVLFV